MMWPMPLFPWRSLRVRVIALLVLSVVGVLTAAMALDIRLSTRMAERNLQERALTLAKEIDILLGSLWGRTDLRNFHHRLGELARTHRNVADIEILLPVGDEWRLLGSSGRARPAEPIPLDRLAMELDRPLWELLPGSAHLGLAVAPFHLGQRVIGSIRVKASLAEVERLSNAQARQALLLTLLSVIGISAVLGLILTRTIARPVRLLVDAMNAARAGRLDTRVHLRGSDELQQLGDHFNRMLETIATADQENRELVGRLSRFNDELETRVAAATARHRREEPRAAADQRAAVARAEAARACGAARGARADDGGDRARARHPAQLRARVHAAPRTRRSRAARAARSSRSSSRRYA